jgi:hypothetical protein
VLRVWTDFNARTQDGVCRILMYNDLDLELQVASLRLMKGDKVRLFQDENDFEVTGTLDFRFVDVLEREAWVAVPDWSTIVRK